MIPSPQDRLRDRLAHMPRACRDLLAAMDRQAARGGGRVQVWLQVDGAGQLEAVELVTRYERRLEEGDTPEPQRGT